VVTTYVYDAAGNLAAEYGAPESGQASDCGTPYCYVSVDQLGSTRLVTDSNGNVVKRYDFLPFGEEAWAGPSPVSGQTNNWGGRTTAMGYQTGADGFNPKFTGQQRDPESMLDYFHARYYAPYQGRFVSPDPGNAGADARDPQTWSGYAYVGNNPLNYTDPTGENWLTWLGIGLDIAGAFIGDPFVGSALGISTTAAATASHILVGIGGIVTGGSILGGLSTAGAIPGLGANGMPTGAGGIDPSLGGLGGLMPGTGSPFILDATNGGAPSGLWYAWLWHWGLLPDTIYYGPRDTGTVNMRRSAVVQDLRKAYIGAGCPASFPIDSGHLAPWKESAINLVVGNTTQFVVGGFNGIITTSPDGTTTVYTIRNTTGWSSLLGESSWGPKIGLKSDALDTSRGPGHNVLQVFEWLEPNPCKE
jgi:RHS repeat-associated protein